MTSLPLFTRTLLGLCTALSLTASAQTSAVGSATRSDSIDILHTRIELDLTQTANGLIRGDASITFTPRVLGIQLLPLDLLLPVDSVVMNGAHLSFNQPGEVLYITLPAPYAPGDTLTLHVCYHGNPTTDPSGFGGFYTLSNYQYDLGVAFDAIPHSYGRAWFPCFDNFVERCSFDFLVHTNANRSVFANGALQGISNLGNGDLITHWHLAEPIPSYLASVAAGNYTQLNDTFPSLSGNQVPVILAALAADTTKVRSSFAHLKNAFDTFEHWFGPYRWNRVGYVLTSAGAMEHATNICYPDFAADGTLSNEDLIAHELSHHWFGNLITCARPQEMYLNEGFADFCAKLHMEALYGTDAYMNLVRNNHHDAVAGAHLKDGGWYALANVPQNATYGETSYKKGSDIARTLRSVLGDSVFSAGFKHIFNQNAYTAMGSAALRDSLSVATGVSLTDFFSDWVFQPGGAAFMVDSFIVTPNGNQYDTQVFIRQKTRGGAAFFHQVPVSVTCIGAGGISHRTLANLGNEYGTVVVSSPFAPNTVRLNDDERLALSTTVDTVTITANGQKSLGQADLWLITSAITAPTKLRVEEYWVPADNATTNGTYFTSPDRWWRVEGNITPGTVIKLRFTVDGRDGQATAYDQGLMQDGSGSPIMEDSLLILYRPDPSVAWTPVPSTTTFFGSHTDKYARIDMPGLTAGDYTFGWRMIPSLVPSVEDTERGWLYFPNPGSDMLHIEAPTLGKLDVRVFDATGRTVLTASSQGSPLTLNSNALSPGIYLVQVNTTTGQRTVKWVKQ